MSTNLTNRQSYTSLLQTIERCGGPEGLLKSPNLTTDQIAPDASGPTVAAPRAGITNPIIYLRMNIKILANLPWENFYLVTISDENDTLEGTGVGYLPGVVGATLQNANCTYNVKPGIPAVLPPNDVTFKWVEGGTDDPDLCACEVYSNGTRVMRLAGWAAGESALIGTHGPMHWVQKQQDA
ncbi:hypothetical protein FRC04_004963 [Tulasnella sp. 424]|nr:hypothetical protein FRC04_004963 [Tulasnella sp. 424]KAG8970176.1 hypothetical protein FRC05_000697 [Tulasnella sp. 425]